MRAVKQCVLCLVKWNNWRGCVWPVLLLLLSGVFLIRSCLPWRNPFSHPGPVLFCLSGLSKSPGVLWLPAHKGLAGHFSDTSQSFTSILLCSFGGYCQTETKWFQVSAPCDHPFYHLHSNCWCLPRDNSKSNSGKGFRTSLGPGSCQGSHWKEFGV